MNKINKMKKVVLTAIMLFVSICTPLLGLSNDSLYDVQDDNIGLTAQQQVTESGDIVEMNITTDLINPSVEWQYFELPDGTFDYNKNISYSQDVNGSYTFIANYSIDSVNKTLPITVEVTELATVLAGGNNEQADLLVRSQNQIPEVRGPGQTVALSLSQLNTSLKQPEDYVLGKQDQANFMVDLNIVPTMPAQHNRTVTLEIPAYFALEKDNLEKLIGNSFTNVTVDYAGTYDAASKTFTWLDETRPTRVTFTIPDSQNGEDDTPIGISFRMYQDVKKIGEHGMSPSVTYAFKVKNNVNNHESGFSFVIPFASTGLSLTGKDNGYIKASTNDLNQAVFTITDKNALMVTTDRNLAYPKALKSVMLTFDVNKAASVPANKFVMDIPLPAGYTLDTEGIALSIPKGGVSGQNLQLTKANENNWYAYNASTNVVTVILQKEYAEGILRNNDLLGKAGQLTVPVTRVNSNGSTYDRETNPVIPYDMTNGEELIANQAIKYTETTISGNTSSIGPNVNIKLTDFENKYEFTKTGTNSSIMKNTTNVLLSSVGVKNANVFLSKGYKDVEITYNVSTINQTLAKVTIDAVSSGGRTVDEYTELWIKYIDTNGVEQHQNITDIVIDRTYGKQQEVKIADLSFAANIRTIESFTYKYKYLVGNGASSLMAADLALRISTDTTPGSNNDEETFKIHATMSAEGQEILANDYNYTLTPNNYSATATVSDYKGKAVGQGKKLSSTNNVYASGNLTISAYYPGAKNAYIQLTSGVDDVTNGLQHVTKMQITDIRTTGDVGRVVYNVRGDATNYTVNIPTGGGTIEFPEVDIPTQRYITSIKYYPNELDNNTNTRQISWKLYVEDSKAPYNQYNGHALEAIPSGTFYNVIQKFMSASNSELADAEGSTITITVPADKISYDLSKMNDSNSTVYLTRSYGDKYFSTIIHSTNANDTIDYTNVKSEIDFSDPDTKNDILDMLSLAGGVKVNASRKITDASLTVNYEVTNITTGAKTMKQHVFVEIVPNEMLTFDLAEDEVVSNVTFETDAFLDNNASLRLGLDFYFLAGDVPLTSVYERTIRVGDYKIPVQLSGQPNGATALSKIETQMATTATFIRPNPASEIIEMDLNKYFVTAPLASLFSETDDPRFTYISDEREFSKPILSWTLHTTSDMGDMSNATFTMNGLSMNLLSSVGYVSVSTTPGGVALTGTVEYIVYNITTGVRETRTTAILGDRLHQKVELITSEDEYLLDVIIHADNLVKFDRTQSTTVGYHFKNDKSVSQLLDLTQPTKFVDIPDGYSSNAFAVATFDEETRVSINSLMGSSVSFYQLNNRFRLVANTAYPDLSYYKDQDGGPVTGYSMTIYPDTQKYEDVKLEFVVPEHDDVNKQIFAIVEGIRIDNALDDGLIYYQVNTGEIRTLPITKGESSNQLFMLNAGEYVVGTWLEFPTITGLGTHAVGNVMNVGLTFDKPLTDVTKDGNIIDPAQSFELKVKFSASNYDINTGIEEIPNGTNPLPGELGNKHIIKDLDTATLGTSPVPLIASNFSMNLWATEQNIIDSDVNGNPINASRDIFQGENINFSHEPVMEWQYPQKNVAPDEAYLDNPKLYYIVDSRFTYVANTLKFYNIAGQELDTTVSYHPSNGKSYSVIEVTINDTYHVELGELLDGQSYSAKTTLGKVEYQLSASRFNLDSNVQAVQNSYIDIGYNISSDPTTYIYQHVTDKYSYPPTAYDLGEYAATGKQYMSLGKSERFNLIRNAVVGVTNMATTPTQFGEHVSGSEITEFSENLVISSSVGEIYNFSVYIPIPKKNLSYNYRDDSVGISGTLNSDYDMMLRKQVTSKIVAGRTVNVDIAYGGDITTDTSYPSQVGLSGDIATETAYGAYNANDAENYTMVRVFIDELKNGEYIVLDVPFGYVGAKTSITSETARANIQYAYSFNPTSYSSTVRAATDLSYTIDTYSISGKVWLDNTNNNVLDPAEDEALVNQVVKATKMVNGLEFSYETTTDADGYYNLQVPGGEYTVIFEDKYHGFTYPNQQGFVLPNQGLSDAFSSKASNADATFGQVQVKINERAATNVNAGYYRVLPDTGLIEDIIVWEGETDNITYNNPLNIPITLTNQTLYDAGQSIATVKNTGRVTGNNKGTVQASYSYPDGIGGTVHSHFNVEVRPTYVVSYEVLPDSSGNINGTLEFDENYIPPYGLTELQEKVFDQKDGNLVKHLPTPQGNDTGNGVYTFLGWTSITRTPFDPATSTITGDTTVYANFSIIPGAAVTVKYVDENNNAVHPEEELNGNFGEEYTTTPLDIPGWLLKTTPENANGKFTHDTQEVIYVYTKEPVETIDALPTTGEQSQEIIVIAMIMVLIGSGVLLARRRYDQLTK